MVFKLILCYLMGAICGYLVKYFFYETEHKRKLKIFEMIYSRQIDRKITEMKQKDYDDAREAAQKKFLDDASEAARKNTEN